MSEDKEIKKNDIIDDVSDKEEYERALEVLNKSKSARVKKITDEKKAKKKQQKEVSKRTASGSGSSGNSGNGFIDKCKKDPVIPACILLLIIAAVGFGIYILVPMFSVKTLGITVDELRDRYASTGIYNSTLLPYNFAIPQVSYTEGQSVALTASAESSNKNNDRLLYFSANIPNTATGFGTAIQGSVSKNDSKITAIRIMATFSPEYLNDSSYMSFLVLYFGSYLQAFEPSISDRDAQTLVYDAINQMSTGEFVTRQDIAYRVSLITGDTVNYVAFDIVPAANLDK